MLDLKQLLVDNGDIVQWVCLHTESFVLIGENIGSGKITLCEKVEGSDIFVITFVGHCRGRNKLYDGLYTQYTPNCYAMTFRGLKTDATTLVESSSILITGAWAE